jgi:hypothetical protein
MCMVMIIGGQAACPPIVSAFNPVPIGPSEELLRRFTQPGFSYDL